MIRILLQLATPKRITFRTPLQPMMQGIGYKQQLYSNRLLREEEITNLTPMGMQRPSSQYYAQESLKRAAQGFARLFKPEHDQPFPTRMGYATVFLKTCKEQETLSKFKRLLLVATQRRRPAHEPYVLSETMEDLHLRTKLVPVEQYLAFVAPTKEKGRQISADNHAPKIRML